MCVQSLGQSYVVICPCKDSAYKAYKALVSKLSTSPAADSQGWTIQGLRAVYTPRAHGAYMHSLSTLV